MQHRVQILQKHASRLFFFLLRYPILHSGCVHVHPIIYSTKLSGRNCVVYVDAATLQPRLGRYVVYLQSSEEISSSLHIYFLTCFFFFFSLYMRYFSFSQIILYEPVPFFYLLSYYLFIFVYLLFSSFVLIHSGVYLYFCTISLHCRLLFLAYALL